MTDSLEDIELSVVVLAYKAEEYAVDFIGQLLRETESLGVTFEIVVVANYVKGSSDNTASVVRKKFDQHPKVRIISKEKEGMMGWDMRAGLDAARGKYIAVIDGDGQMPSSDVNVVYKMILPGDFDLVKTYRANRYDGFYRRLLSAIYNWMFRLLFRPATILHDINSKPKIFTREVYQKMNLVSNDWFTDAEIMIEAIRLKLRVCEVATVFYKNQRRESFVGPVTVFEFIYNLIYYRFFRINKV